MITYKKKVLINFLLVVFSFMFISCGYASYGNAFNGRLEDKAPRGGELKKLEESGDRPIVKGRFSIDVKAFKKPVLLPSGIYNRVYNPTTINYNDLLYFIYRAEGNNTGTGNLCLATSKNGKEIYSQYPHNPIIKGDQPYDELGCEDPRMVKFGDTFYLYYNGNHKDGSAHICLATSKDLIHWVKHGLIMSPKYNWESNQIKAPAPIPEKINGKYYMYYLGQEQPWNTSIGLAESDDLIHWEEVGKTPVLAPREGYFDSLGVEPGVCVVIPEGVLMVYNGWNETTINKASWVLFDKKNPEKVLERSNGTIISIPNEHVFATALTKFQDDWYIYWGAGDYEIQGGTALFLN